MRIYNANFRGSKKTNIGRDLCQNLNNSFQVSHNFQTKQNEQNIFLHQKQAFGKYFRNYGHLK